MKLKSIVFSTFAAVLAWLICFSIAGGSEDFPPVMETPDGARMIFIPGGDYFIGSDEGPQDTMPRHKVTVTAFYIDRTEVTNSRYRKFCLETGHAFPAVFKGANIPRGYEDLPVVGVALQDAEDYARWAKKQVPNEVQWEIAARGIEERIYAWSNVPRKGIAAIGLKALVPVDYFPEDVSEFGVRGMGGNAMEWTSSWFRSYPKAPKQFDQSGQKAAIRGGGICATIEESRTYLRHPTDPSASSECIGFRCVREMKH